MSLFFFAFTDPAAGGSDDWSKSRAGIKYVYLLELRPEEHVFDGFILDTEQLIPCGRETWAGVRVVADRILEIKKLLPSAGKHKNKTSRTIL